MPFEKDAAGQLSEQTEYGLSDGPKADRPEIWHIHRFKRNILGQLVEKTSRRIDGTPVPAEEGKHYSRTRFDYDPLTGNLVKARNRHSSVELVYDVLDRLVSETTVHNGQSATVGYQYDPLGNCTQTVLPDGRSINYLYYGSGHLHQITLDGETISDIERDRLHQEIQRTQGALTSRYDYDPMGRLKHQTATANRTLQHNGKLNTLVGGAVRRSYRYDKAGNLIQTADQRSGVLNYVYDKLGRIESAVNKQTGSSEKFVFDPAHNILSDKVSDGLLRHSGNARCCRRDRWCFPVAVEVVTIGGGTAGGVGDGGDAAFAVALFDQPTLCVVLKQGLMAVRAGNFDRL
ncbi:RHS repeat domain-containing protein [Neisseria zoodegmatis]|nr:RHS repeat protein [Neisseria zoodegmatis]